MSMEIGHGDGMGSQSQQARLQDEIALLNAMYPEQTDWNDRTRELKFICQSPAESATTSMTAASLVLRLSDEYLSEHGSLPTVISAQGFTKGDLRQAVTRAVTDATLAQGQEVLDEIVMIFEQLATTEAAPATRSVDPDVPHPPLNGHGSPETTHDKVVIIWLHHLLATGKRKLALHPTKSPGSSAVATRISGLTKPGYPGIMVFSGHHDCVDSHVAELKSQRWQAFQVRYEDTYADGQGWKFEHGLGIREVESMSDVVSGIRGADHQQAFLTAAGVK